MPLEHSAVYILRTALFCFVFKPDRVLKSPTARLACNSFDMQLQDGYYFESNKIAFSNRLEINMNS